MANNSIRARWIAKAENADLLFLDEIHDNAIMGFCHIRGKTILIYAADRVANNFICEHLIGEYEALNLVSDLADKTPNIIFLFR